MFWTIAAALGQIAGAIATFAAVGVSLWIVISERREKIKLSVGERAIVGAGTKIDVIAFQITNVGHRPVRINSFGWRVGWLPRGPTWLRYEWAFQTPGNLPVSDNPPIDVLPGRSASMFIELDPFLTRASAKDGDLFGPRQVPLLGRCLPPIYGCAYTAMGSSYSSKVEIALARQLAASSATRQS